MLDVLKERAKELNCLYQIEEIHKEGALAGRKGFSRQGAYLNPNNRRSDRSSNLTPENGTHSPGMGQRQLSLFYPLKLPKTWFITADGTTMPAEINYLKTGYTSQGLLDVHFVTDEDIANKTSFAVKIGAVTDPAHPLKLKKEI